ncbi:MAG TPA: SRPBCC family protein [Candidatus Acidoferrum sp.]|nr:SRPBCC family protein [Candidatus Acidoferrum sp.]
MAISVSHAIEINATPQLVWEVFTDIHSWSEWNPLIVDVHQITGGGVWIPGGVFVQKYKSSFMPEEIITTSVVREVFQTTKITWLGEVLGSNGVTSYEFVPFGPKTVVRVTEEFAETQSSQLNFVIQQTTENFLILSLAGLKKYIEDIIGHKTRRRTRARNPEG